MLFKGAGVFGKTAQGTEQIGRTDIQDPARIGVERRRTGRGEGFTARFKEGMVMEHLEESVRNLILQIVNEAMEKQDK